MYQCRHCGEPLRSDTDPPAVRCPRCHEPLYERAGGPERLGPEKSDTDEDGEQAAAKTERRACAQHHGNVAVGTCQRCGNAICPVCRTRWRQQVLCLGCVDRLMGDAESQPEAQAAHRRRALLGLLFGLGAWLLAALAILPVLVALGRQDRSFAMWLALGLWVLSLVPAVFGLGQAAAAVRWRGQRVPLAIAGLVVSGSYIGLFIGAIVLQLGRM